MDNKQGKYKEDLLKTYAQLSGMKVYKLKEKMKTIDWEKEDKKLNLRRILFFTLTLIFVILFGVLDIYKFFGGTSISYCLTIIIWMFVSTNANTKYKVFKLLKNIMSE